MEYRPEGTSRPFGHNKCIILEQKESGLVYFGKHESHPPHFWWYTSYGGGHQMQDDFVPTKVFINGTGWDNQEHCVFLHECPGRG